MKVENAEIISCIENYHEVATFYDWYSHKFTFHKSTQTNEEYDDNENKFLHC